MKTTAVLLFSALLIAPAFARSDTRSFSHFAHKSCSSSSCYSKHPSGSYTFPYHEGHRH